MKIALAAVGLTALGLMACSQEPEAPPGQTDTSATPQAGAPANTAAVRAPLGATARAQLVNAEGGQAGTATFTQGPLGVAIRVEATGLTPGWHGLHLHGMGMCEAPFESAGGHIQSQNGTTPHGWLNAQGPDAGDLPNLYVGEDGRGFTEVFTTLAALNEGGPGEYLMDQDGASILIHANPYDHSSQPIGGAGDRVACGVIQGS